MPSGTTGNVTVKALRPFGYNSQQYHAGQSVAIDEKTAVDLACGPSPVVTITGTLSTRGTAYQTAVATFYSDTVYPTY
jgi:hypothetical protein